MASQMCAEFNLIKKNHLEIDRFYLAKSNNLKFEANEKDLIKIYIFFLLRQ